MNTLKTTPFEIVWGDHIWAKVVAINDYGYSEESDPGNNAQIITYPDAPLNFAEDYSLRTATSASLTWLQGSANGGSPVIDYQVVYDDRTITDFILNESNILELFHTADELESGSTYRFKVQARNSFGLSAYSEELTLTIGFIPEVPSAPTT